MLLTIPAVKERIAPVCKAHGVAKVYLFGTYARGEATEESDVDLHIEGGRIRGLFELSGFRQDIVEALEKDVDIITCVPKPEHFRENLEREEILLYAN